MFQSENLTLFTTCENYWSIDVDDEGITFVTFSDLISSGFLGSTSIMAFYLGVAYLIGTTLRKALMYTPNFVFTNDIPNPDAILNLIEAIYMMRLEQNLKK